MILPLNVNSFGEKIANNSNNLIIKDVSVFKDYAIRDTLILSYLNHANGVIQL